MLYRSVVPTWQRRRAPAAAAVAFAVPAQAMSSQDDAPLLTPGRQNSANFVADKHVILRKPEDEREKVGLTFMDTEDGSGVLVSGMEQGSVAIKSDLLVGEQVISIDGQPATTFAHAKAMLQGTPFVKTDPPGFVMVWRKPSSSAAGQAPRKEQALRGAYSV